MARRSKTTAHAVDPQHGAHTGLVAQKLAQSDEALFVEELHVEERYDGWRLDRFLSERIQRSSRTKIQHYLQHNVELVPPRRVKASGAVRMGDIVRIVRRERIMPNMPTPDDILVLARFGPTAVVTKPAGILVHRNSREVSHTMDAYLLQRFPDEGHVEAVHRLDRDTSGCMLAAFGKEAVVKWRVAFQDRGVAKVYLAIVEDPEGRWPVGRDHVIDIPLGQDTTSVLSVRMGRGPLSARTRAICRQREGARALIELHPIEGRQHQLRAHLFLSGTPIVGDKLYFAGDAYFMRWSDDPEETQAKEPLATPYHCLHAWQLSFDYEGERQTVVAPLPQHFFDAMPSLDA